MQFPEAYQATTGPRQEPKYDLHAPDLYIPTMAFTTYVILNAFALGTYGECVHSLRLRLRLRFRALRVSAPASSHSHISACAPCVRRFNPDVLFNTGSSCLGLLTFEFIILRLGLMFFNTEAPPKLDIFAITGYKFVACVPLSAPLSAPLSVRSSVCHAPAPYAPRLATIVHPHILSDADRARRTHAHTHTRRLSLLVLAHIFGLGEITILYYLKFLIVSTAQAFFLVKSLEYAMGRTAAGGAEEMVKLLRFVLGGLQIPFIFFLMP